VHNVKIGMQLQDSEITLCDLANSQYTHTCLAASQPDGSSAGVWSPEAPVFSVV